MPYRTAALSLFALLFATVAAEAGVGTSGADFLLIPPGARPAALGEAFTAVADEGSGPAYNPAGISRNRRKRVTTGYTFYLEDSDYEYLSYIHPLSDGKAVGVSFTGLQVIDIRRDRDGNSMGSFTNSDLAVGLTYGQPVGPVRVGGTAKFIHRSLDVYNASAYALDLGVQGDLFFENWIWGVAVTNLGNDLKFLSVGDPLPTTWRAGIGVWAFDHKLLALADLTHLRGTGNAWNLGLEWEPVTGMFARAGYVSRGEVTAEESFRGGFGFKHSIGEIDYAVGDMSEMGYVHRFTYSLPFGDNIDVAPVESEQRQREAEYEKMYREYLDRYYRETR